MDKCIRSLPWIRPRLHAILPQSTRSRQMDWTASRSGGDSSDLAVESLFPSISLRYDDSACSWFNPRFALFRGAVA